MDNSPGEEHTAFTQWAVSHGIKIKGIAPARFPGRRLGMIATRDIEVSMSVLFHFHFIVGWAASLKLFWDGIGLCCDMII